MTKSSAFILRLYFAVVAAVTLFTLMFGTIDLLSIGLKTYVFTAADAPGYLEDCQNPLRYAPESDDLTEEEILANCERRNQAAEQQYEQQKASDAVRNLALILVSLPLFLLHFRVVYRDWTGEDSEKSKK